MLRQMREVEAEGGENWLKTEEGFERKDDDDVEIDYVKLGSKMLSRILTSSVVQGSMNYILQLVQAHLGGSGDWRA